MEMPKIQDWFVRPVAQIRFLAGNTISLPACKYNNQWPKSNNQRKDNNQTPTTKQKRYPGAPGVLFFWLLMIMFFIGYCDLIIGHCFSSLRVSKNAHKNATRERFFRQITTEGFLGNRPCNFVHYMFYRQNGVYVKHLKNHGNYGEFGLSYL